MALANLAALLAANGLRVLAVDWDAFFRWHNGGAFMRDMRADMAARYDYVLLDSSSGVTPSAFVCALQMPDDLIFCLGMHPQSIVESGAIARRVSEGRLGRRIRILPVLTRIDEGEKERADQLRALACREFAGFPAGMTEAERRPYRSQVELPYRPFYSSTEMPAIFGDEAGIPASWCEQIPTPSSSNAASPRTPASLPRAPAANLRRSPPLPARSPSRTGSCGRRARPEERRGRPSPVSRTLRRTPRSGPVRVRPGVPGCPRGPRVRGR